MAVAATQSLFAFGGSTTGKTTVLDWISLPTETDYFAWLSVPYYDVLPGGILGAQNAVAADVVCEIDAQGNVKLLPIVAFGGKFGSYVDWSNLRPTAWKGHAKEVGFRLQVWGTALEVIAQGFVLFPP